MPIQARQKLSDFQGDHLSVKMFEAVADGVRVTDAAMTSGSAVLSSASSATAEVGMAVIVHGAGAAGADLITTVASLGPLTLAAVAATAVTAGTAYWGTNNQASFDAAMAYAFARGIALHLPAGIYLCNNLSTDVDGSRIFGHPGTRIKCLGAGACLTLDGTITSNGLQFFVDNLILDGNSGSTFGLFAQAANHCALANIRVTNVAGEAFRLGSSVVTEFRNVVCSGNVEAFAVQPAKGIVLTALGVLGTTGPGGGGVTLINPTIEGVSGEGIIRDHQGIVTLGGTSEGNGTGELYTAKAIFCVNYGMDMEVNSVGDILMHGRQNAFHGGNFTSTVSCEIYTAAVMNTFDGCYFNYVQLDAGAQFNNFFACSHILPTVDNATQTSFRHSWNATVNDLFPDSSWATRVFHGRALFGNDTDDGASALQINDSQALISRLTAPNGAAALLLGMSAGADATLGPINLFVRLKPSAAEVTREVQLDAVDNVGGSTLHFNPGGGRILIGAVDDDGSTLFQLPGRIRHSIPTAANGTPYTVWLGSAGADATLGPMQIRIQIIPAATGGGRSCIIQTFDNAAVRDLSLNPSGNTILNILKAVSGLLSAPGNSATDIVNTQAAQTLKNKDLSDSSNTIPLPAGGVTLTTNQSITGVKTVTDKEFVIASSDTAGGTADLRFDNTFSTTIHKYIRLRSSGVLQFINSAYSAILMALDDAGVLTLPTPGNATQCVVTTDATQTLKNKDLSDASNTPPTLASVGSPGTYGEVTTDSKGRVTSGTNVGLGLTITTARLTTGGTTGTMTFTNGKLTASSQAT